MADINICLPGLYMFMRGITTSGVTLYLLCYWSISFAGRWQHWHQRQCSTDGAAVRCYSLGELVTLENLVRRRRTYCDSVRMGEPRFPLTSSLPVDKMCTMMNNESAACHKMAQRENGRPWQPWWRWRRSAQHIRDGCERNPSGGIVLLH